MNYVLCKIVSGRRKYVTEPGSKFSYTIKLENARRYETREQAINDACGNETAVHVSQI